MTVLREGSAGPAVKILQAMLLSAGFDPRGDDGDFGSDTDAAVRAFQAARGLTVDGEVEWPAGETADALNATPNAPSPASNIAVPDDAVTIATDFEGFSATPYQDSVGVWTYLFGSTRDPDGNPVTAATPPGTRALGLQLMRRDMMAAAAEIARDVNVALTDDQRAALDDFIYNVGAGNFRASTLLRKLNAGDYANAAAEFDKWDRAGGRVLAGLLRRREVETTEFLKP